MDFNTMVRDYISQCDKVLEEGDNSGAKDLTIEIISIFESIIPKIFTGIHAYSYGGNYLEDIRNLKGKLQLLIAIGGDYSRFKPERNSVNIHANSSVSGSGNSTNTNTNTQNQTVNNKFDIKLELDKVRAEVEADEVLGDEDKEEINEKLNEIEEVMNGSPTNNEKWKKLKSTFSWIATKSYKVGQWIMPIITKALFPEE